MTILEALRVTTESIKSWVESKFLKKTDVDTALSATSENPVQNKVVNIEIENLKTSIENLDVTEQINEAIGAIDYPVDSVNNKTGSVVLTADDLGVYVQPDEPTDAEEGAIWIDTANDPSVMEHDAPVKSVNGMTGNVVIEIPKAPVTSVNGMIGDVAINVPLKTSDLTNDSGFISNYTETDPTVPAWAKASSKPTYTKSEVGLGNVDDVKQYSVDNPPPYPVTSVNGMTGDVIIEVGSGGEQIQSDWNQNDPEQPDYVKNRTHWEEGPTVIEWDGNTEGRECPADGAHYHVSNEIPTVEYFINGVATVTMEDGSAQEMPITEDEIAVEENGIFWMGVCVAYVDEAVVSGMTFPKAGTYFLCQEGLGYVSKLTYGSVTVHPIDEKFIPESIARVADIPEGLPAVTTADNGKVLMVVDGAWAVVDINLTVDADGVLSV